MHLYIKRFFLFIKNNNFRKDSILHVSKQIIILVIHYYYQLLQTNILIREQFYMYKDILLFWLLIPIINI